MTSMILINATLGAAVLAALLTVVAWAIKTQHRDALGVVAPVGARRPKSAAPQRVARRELATQVG
jgi:hypothetical protein